LPGFDRFGSIDETGNITISPTARARKPLRSPIGNRSVLEWVIGSSSAV
jgi:hypothetical protein